MKIVIDIPEGLRNDFESERWTALSCMEMKDALMNGTPLPKGHGRLIDVDELELDSDWDDYYDGYMAYSESMIKYAPTIIDADKESD